MCLNFYENVGDHVLTIQTSADKHTAAVHMLKV